ncbi:MAG TPA: tetratricopeptide repeat protein [Thermoanaerobaculia bacterium]|nr:tetratricopeptide repeat protein [Thermoanaerobaculia bacterium]
MFEDHPTVGNFETFLGSLSRPAGRARNPQILRHLLADCPDCRARLGALGWSQQRLRLLTSRDGDSFREESFTSDAANGYDYGHAFAAVDRAVAALLTQEPPAEIPADALMAELLELPTNRQAPYVAGNSRFGSPPFVRLLIHQSHAARYRNADQMLHLAGLARLAAEICTPELAGNALRLADLQTRAWGQYGNALRVCGKPREAEEAFATAQARRQMGTKDPALRAWLFEKITPLYIFRERYMEAVELCEQAAHIYQELGENHLLASTLVQKAVVCVYSGETAVAIRTLNQAIPLIDHEEDPQLLLAACHNLIRCYIDLGRPDQALLIYSETRDLYHEFDDALILLRALWQEGQLLRDLGHLRAAETALQRARTGFLKDNLIYEAALVSLDLASVYVKLGLIEDLKTMVATTLPVFRALQVEQKTIASLLQLQQIADQEYQALELIRSLSSRIEPLARRSSAR